MSTKLMTSCCTAVDIETKEEKKEPNKKGKRKWSILAFLFSLAHELINEK